MEASKKTLVESPFTIESHLDYKKTVMNRILISILENLILKQWEVELRLVVRRMDKQVKTHTKLLQRKVDLCKITKKMVPTVKIGTSLFLVIRCTIKLMGFNQI